MELHDERAMSLLEPMRFGLEVLVHWLKHILGQSAGHPDANVEVCEAVLVVDPELREHSPDGRSTSLLIIIGCEGSAMIENHRGGVQHRNCRSITR
jgi:hypothetical protein